MKSLLKHILHNPRNEVLMKKTTDKIWSKLISNYMNNILNKSSYLLNSEIRFRIQREIEIESNVIMNSIVTDLIKFILTNQESWNIYE